jgi:hypothetical protein
MTPFPALDEALVEGWQWPMPPFAWRRQLQRPDDTLPQPCRLETPSGVPLDGEMLSIKPSAGHLNFRTGPKHSALAVPFARFCRLTLLTPLRPDERLAMNAPLERVPAAAQEREYRLTPQRGSMPLTGRTLGHVKADEGLYLFTPMEDERSALRVFVPRWAYASCEFGPSAEELAARRWIGSRTELLQAIAQQDRMPVLRTGQALLDLGLVTEQQLERALARQTPEMPLGEMLVAEGVISRSDLQTALAHKMGYPLVDLARFPADPEVLRRWSPRLAVEYRALPLMQDGERLIVAVDKPSRVRKLRELQSFAHTPVVPVLASKSHIKQALVTLVQQDVWSHSVGARADFFATTI